MTTNYKLLDILRRGRTPHENHLIDGLRYAYETEMIDQKPEYLPGIYK